MLSRRTMDTIILNLMSMDTIFTRGLLMPSPDMALLMSMLSRRIMDTDILNLMSMDTIFTRGLLMLNPAMDTAMAMVPPMFILPRPTMAMGTQHPTAMVTISTSVPLVDTRTKCRIEIVPEFIFF